MNLDYIKVGAIVVVDFKDVPSKNVLITGFNLSDLIQARKKHAKGQVCEVAVNGMYFEEDDWHTVRFQHTMIKRELGMLHNEWLTQQL